jgi:hypothetical protein
MTKETGGWRATSRTLKPLCGSQKFHRQRCPHAQLTGHNAGPGHLVPSPAGNFQFERSGINSLKKMDKSKS